MSRMSYLIQEIHFKSDIFFPYAPYKNEEGTGGRGMLSIPKAGALLLFHCPVRTALAAAFPHWFLLPALQRDPGEPDTVLQCHIWHGANCSLSMPQFILCGRELTPLLCGTVRVHSSMFLKHSELWQWSLCSVKWLFLFSRDCYLCSRYAVIQKWKASQ